MNLNQKSTRVLLAIVIASVVGLLIISDLKDGIDSANSEIQSAQPSPSTSLSNLPSASVSAEVQTIKNYCVLKTGYIRSSTKVTCQRAEIAIGIGPLTKRSERPDRMNPLLANRIEAAQILAKKQGFNLAITSGWRSIEYQQKLFDQAVIDYGSVKEASKRVLPPEYSLHPWGLAVDINFTSKKSDALNWLEENGYQVGLCRRYSNEWWHYEPLVAPGQKCPPIEINPTVRDS